MIIDKVDSVASIYLKDGTTVDVARIQGSPAYKAYMRFGRHSMRVPGYPINDDVLAIKALVASLKDAVETYFGTSICFAAASADRSVLNHAGLFAFEATGLTHIGRPFSKNFFRNYRSCEVYSPNTYPWDRRSAVVRAHLPSPLIANACEKLYWKVLAIEFGSSWVSVELFDVNDEGEMDHSMESRSDPIHVDDEGYTIDPSMASRSDDIFRDPIFFYANATSGTDAADELRSKFEKMFADPSPNIPDFAKVDQVIVFGDNARDPSLNSVLNGVLGSDVIAGAVIDDSAFTGVRGIAKSLYEIMDTVEFEMKDQGAFTCQLRSGLYTLRWWDPLWALGRDVKERLSEMKADVVYLYATGSWGGVREVLWEDIRWRLSGVEYEWRRLVHWWKYGH